MKIWQTVNLYKSASYKLTCQTIFDEIIDYLLETIVTLCNTNNVFMQTFKHIIAIALCAIVGFTAVADKNGGSNSPSLGDIIATPKPNKREFDIRIRLFNNKTISHLVRN